LLYVWGAAISAKANKQPKKPYGLEGLRAPRKESQQEGLISAAQAVVTETVEAGDIFQTAFGVSLHHPLQ
jgi:hypothetical protein